MKGKKMIDCATDRYRVEFELPFRSTPGEAEMLHDRLLAVLEEHAPELLRKKVGKVVPGGSPLKDIGAKDGTTII